MELSLTLQLKWRKFNLKSLDSHKECEESALASKLKIFVELNSVKKYLF